ncbi:MAG: hypothetical protein ACXVPD_13360, partial [Bacteroidia bacterium]
MKIKLRITVYKLDKISAAVFCFLLLTTSGFGQHKKNYAGAMATGISLLDSARTSADFMSAAEDFGQIARQEKNDWLSAYYAGVCYALVAFEKKGKDIDAFCDKAEQYAAMADSLKRNEAEVLVLKSMIASARIGVSPAARGQKFGSRATAFINDALKADPDNPRAYLMKAQGIYYTPELFGGGPAKSKPLYEAAIGKYKVYKSKGGLYPHWGKDVAEKQLMK